MRGWYARHGLVCGVQRLASEACVYHLRVSEPLDQGRTIILASHVIERGRASGHVTACAAEALEGLAAFRQLVVAIKYAHKYSGTDGQHCPVP